MSIAVSVIVDSVSTTLVDTAHRMVTVPEIIGYLNEALRATEFVKPDMYTLQEFIPLVEGDLQTLPDGGVEVMQISENESNGRVITQSDFGLLQESNRFWPGGTKEKVVENYAADPRNPRRFIVSPPNDGTGSVRVLYGAVPPTLANTTDTLPVTAVYQTPLTNFVLAKCYMKNSNRQDLTKSSGYMAQWGQLIGLRSQAQIAAASRIASQPGTT